jgi:hypothetical protein
MKELKHLKSFEQFEIEFNPSEILDEEFLGLGTNLKTEYQKLDKNNEANVAAFFKKAIIDSNMVVANNDNVRKQVKLTLEKLTLPEKLDILQKAAADEFKGRISFTASGNKYKVFYKSSKDVKLHTGFEGGGTGGNPTGGTSGA